MYCHVMSLQRNISAFVILHLAFLQYSPLARAGQTWVTYHARSVYGNSHEKVLYQIDLQSIFKRGSEVHANARSVRDGKQTYQWELTAYCNRGIIHEYSSGRISTRIRRNGWEWWTQDNISAGNRKPMDAQYARLLGEKKDWSDTDSKFSNVFSYMCE